MNRSSLYKTYQLYEYFLNKHSYISYNFLGKDFQGELWLGNRNNPYYQLIRLSSKNDLNNTNDDFRFKAIKDIFKKEYQLDEINLLDIHVGIYDYDLKENIVFLDVNYHNGIDLNNYYPGIYDVIHETKDEEEEIKRLLNKINTNIKSNNDKNKESFFKNLFKSKFVVTNSLIIISVLMFIVSIIFQRNYSQSASLIYLGADYKMFTLGLKQFWRLFTYSFLHGSLIHLFTNCLSIYVIGTLLEKRIGHLKFLFIYFAGVLGASLTHGVLLGNSLAIGMSGGIYALFIFFILYFNNLHMINLTSLIPTLVINLIINFLPGVSWQGHLGGAIIGVICYFIFKDNKINYRILPLIFILFIGLFTKYYKDNYLKPYYGATDSEVIKMIDKNISSDLASDLNLKLLKIYYSGGENDN